MRCFSCYGNYREVKVTTGLMVFKGPPAFTADIICETSAQESEQFHLLSMNG